MRRLFRVLLIVLVLLAAGAAAAALWVDRYVRAPMPLQERLAFEVPAGASLNQVAHDLAARGAMEHPRPWVWYARFKGLARNVQAGEYEIGPGATPLSVLERMVRGEVILRAVTVVEGTTYRRLLDTLAAQPRLRQTVQALTDEALMTQLGADSIAPEGQFFPDTYHFAAGTADIEILRRAHDEMQRRLEAAWADRVAGLPLETPYEALILASIVEKETGLASERAKIAGVFIRRLRMGMRLQSDPTVIYGLGMDYDGDIRTRDLRGDTPFNTYTRGGLPPTPIALPGEGALRAVTRPDDTGALYFVATGEPDGSHSFSRTLEEHNAAVRRYLQRTRGGRR